MGKRINFPDTVSLRMPAGSTQRIEDAAEAEGMSPAEWLRSVVRKALEAHSRKQRRAGGAR